MTFSRCYLNEKRRVCTSESRTLKALEAVDGDVEDVTEFTEKAVAAGVKPLNS